VHATGGTHVAVPGRRGSAPPGPGCRGRSCSRRSAPLPVRSGGGAGVSLCGRAGDVARSWMAPALRHPDVLLVGWPAWKRALARQTRGCKLWLGRSSSPSCCARMLEIVFPSGICTWLLFGAEAEGDPDSWGSGSFVANPVNCSS